MPTTVIYLCTVNLPVPTKELQVLRAQLLVLLWREATLPNKSNVDDLVLKKCLIGLLISKEEKPMPGHKVAKNQHMI
jgi:hypothetical protein